jgi:flagellar hook-associated protein 2
MADATFRAGGLASGLDTNSIIDQLMKIEQRPVDKLKLRQDGLRTQVSTLASIISKLSELKTSAQSLGSGGALATKIDSGTATGFSATTGTGATAGSHTVDVDFLAVAAQQRSAAFGSATAPVRGGSLTLRVMGTDYNVNIAHGAALSDVALAIRQSGAPVSATVVNDGTSNYLSILNNETGFPLTGVAADALTITENYTGTGNSVLGFASVQTAVNAEVNVDGLLIKRTSNNVSDVIPGVTLSLKAPTTTAETVVIGNDITGTSTNIQKFVDAYNETHKLIQAQLQSSSTTDRATTLAGDAALRSLQRSLQSLITSEVTAGGTVRALADLGVKSARDGSLSIDSTVLKAAIARDSASVNALFADATEGLGKVTLTLTTNYTNAVNGILVSKRKGLEVTVEKMNDAIETLEMRIETRRQGLIAQFAAMEKIVSNMRSLGNFLSQQSGAGSQS